MNEDGDIKIDSSHSDIGSKTISSTIVGVPKKSNTKDTPSRKSKDEDELEFEPAKDGEIVTPNAESPTEKVPLKKVRSKPVKVPEAEVEELEPIVPKPAKITSAEAEELEPVMP